MSTIERFGEVVRPVSLRFTSKYLLAITPTVSVYRYDDVELPFVIGEFKLPNDGYMIDLLGEYKSWLLFSSGYIGAFFVNQDDINNTKVIHACNSNILKAVMLTDGHLIFLGSNGGEILDCSELPKSKKVACLNHEIWDAVVKGEYLFCACGKLGFRVYSLSDINTPLLVYKSSREMLCMSIERLSDSIIIVKDEHGQILFVDISKPWKPIVVSRISGPFLPYKNYFIYMHYLIVRENSHTIKVFDYNDPFTPTLVCTFGNREYGHLVNSADLIACWNIPKNEETTAFGVLHISNTGHIEKVLCEKSSEIYSVAIRDNSIYWAEKNGLFKLHVPV